MLCSPCGLVVIEQAVLGKLFVLGARATVIGERIDTYTTARGEESSYLDVLGVHQSYEVLHDDVYAILVERPVTAETEEVQLEALALYHPYARNVADTDFCKIGLPCNGAEGCEFGAVETGIIDNAKAVYEAFSWNKGFKEYFAVKATPNPILMQVLKALENFRSVVFFILYLAPKRAQAFFFSCCH